jgi:nucleoid-associated protein YgaU
MTHDARLVLVLVLAFILSGCVVRTYRLSRDRIDQDISSGNRGYIKGTPGPEPQDRRTTRTTQMVEVELHSPVKLDTSYIAPEHKAGKAAVSSVEEGPVTSEATGSAAGQAEIVLQKYTVQKGDTLQKISQKFYGTTRKWMKIYDANKELLKAPNKIYPGQVIDVPLEPMKKGKENLK